MSVGWEIVKVATVRVCRVGLSLRLGVKFEFLFRARVRASLLRLDPNLIVISFRKQIAKLIHSTCVNL